MKTSLSLSSIIFWCIALFVLQLPTTAHAKTTTSRIDLSGDWLFQSAELKPSAPELYTTSSQRNANWENIQVPSNWYLAGKKHYGKAWYKKSFQLNAKYIGRYIRVNFQGVDYAADVWINGHYLGHHEGYFQAFDFDVSKHVKEGLNFITVLVDSPTETPEAWSLDKRLIKGIFSHHDTRPGGAWTARGQEKNTGGIWAPVTLEISDKVAVKRIEVVPEKNLNFWSVNTRLTMGSKIASNSQLLLKGSIRPENFNGQSIYFEQEKRIKKGDSILTLNFPVDAPSLWWPRDYGKPNLYRMHINVMRSGKLLAQKEVVFGFREVNVDPITQQWEINGRRLFIRGTNYISSQWLSEMSPENYSRDITLMEKANVNAIRVHAHIEASDFYRLCDLRGMLVFQDFPLQWGYSDDKVFIDEARKQVKEMVHSFNNHPSIVEWSLHNEPPWDASWMQHKYTEYDPTQNKILDDLLFSDVESIESSRNIRKHSATGEHAWMGWYSGDWKDFNQATKEPWISEFGAQALPNYDSLKKIFNADELWPDNDNEWRKWEYHNFQKRETFEIAKVPQGKNINEFISNTQAYQVKLTKLAAESYRRQRYAPVAGIFQFMFVENWPSINWGLVDYWRNAKPAYTALAEAYQPVLPSIEWRQDNYKVGDQAVFGLWIVNDLWKRYPDSEYRVELVKAGQTIKSKSFVVQVEEDSSRKLDDFNVVLMESGDYSLQTKVISLSGVLIAQNHYDFQVESN